MVILGRLAIDARHQGEGRGHDLLIDAIVHAAAAGQHAAARFVAVDPIDDSARRFYSHFGSTDIAGDVNGRMYIRIDEAFASFEQAGDDNHVTRAKEVRPMSEQLRL
jgi:ribosomal protein S18 acetylase RimI-like enzyme